MVNVASRPIDQCVNWSLQKVFQEFTARHRRSRHRFLLLVSVYPATKNVLMNMLLHGWNGLIAVCARCSSSDIITLYIQCGTIFSTLWYKSCKILNLSLERYWMYLNTVYCVHNSTVCTLFGQIVCSLTSYIVLLNQPGFCLTSYNLPVFNHYRKTHFITVDFLCWDIVWSLFINKKDLCSLFQHLVQTSHKTHFLLSLLNLGGQRIWMSSWDEGTKQLDPFKWHQSNCLSIHNFITCTAPIN